jgi:D-alanyl-D-alanine carboxypeptidase/D-alanyl-D-alanine-endopeptidase (penicillin-binding protein 4)
LLNSNSPSTIRVRVKPRRGKATVLITMTVGLAAVSLPALMMGGNESSESPASPPRTVPAPATVLDAPLRPAEVHVVRPARPITMHRASPNAEAALSRRVTELVKASLGTDTVSVSIRACDDGPGPGREIVAIEAGRPMIPASNMKVVSTGAALHALGLDFDFVTRILRDGNTFFVVGDGDPSLGDPALFEKLVLTTVPTDGADESGDAVDTPRFDEETILDFWVTAITEAAGDEPVRLLVDDSIFDSVRWNDGWNPADRLKWYSAEVSGLNFHCNTFHFRPAAAGGGGRPDWTDMRPRAGWLLEASRNISTRGGPNDRSTAWISRRPEANDLTFRGVVCGRFTDSHEPLEVTFHDPSMVLADLLAERLQQRGVEITSIGRADAPPPAEARMIRSVVRTPILPIVERCNEKSQNLYAEALLKRTVHARTGRPGSWNDADAVIREIASERLGDAAPELLESVRISDGSGLSRDNRVTASFVTAWLDSFDDDLLLGPEFLESLSRGGLADDGTLSRRFKTLPEGCQVDGKSGYINGVSTLSGFITTPDGRRWTFSVLCNRNGLDVSAAKTLQERVVNAVAQHGLTS